MKAKQFYEDSTIDGMHNLSLGVITLKEEELYQLMEDYALEAMHAVEDLYDLDPEGNKIATFEEFFK